MKSGDLSEKATLSQLRTIIRAGAPRWRLIVFGALVLLVEAIATLAFPLVTRQVIDGLAGQKVSPGGLLSNPAVWKLAAVLTIAAVAAAVGKYVLTKAGLSMVAVLKKALVANLLDKPAAYFDLRESGDHVSRVNNDTGVIAKLIADATPNLFSGIMLLVGSATILFLLDASLATALFGIIISAFVLMVPAISRISKITFDQNETTARLASRLTQLFSNIRLVKSFTAERLEKDRTALEIDALYRHGLRAARVQSMLQPVISMAMTFALVAIFLYGGARIVSGTLSVGTLTAFILYIFNVIAPLVQLSAFVTQLQASRGAAVSLLAIMEAPAEHPNGPDYVSLPVYIPTRGDLEFQNLSFSYDGCAPALSIDRLVIGCGQRTAIIGPSGSGKTTLLSLVERFCEPERGVIRYSDVDISSLPLLEWRRRIGYVPQNAPLFSGTVRDNILYGTKGPVSDEKMFEAAHAANCIEFIQGLDSGFDTMVGEDGVRLSGGQRQRLAIARMFMRDPEILLLDEATSNLDAGSEQLVLSALDKLMDRRTVVLVTHRTTMLHNMDNVIVIEEGRITATGSSAELMVSSGYFRGLGSSPPDAPRSVAAAG